MYYTIGNEEERYYDIDEVIEEVKNRTGDYIEYYDHSEFDEYLDCDGSLNVGSTSFWPSEILKAMDDDEYENEFESWCESSADSEIDNARYNLRHGRTTECFCYEIVVHEEDELTDEEISTNLESVTEQVDKFIEDQRNQENEAKRIEDSFMQIISSGKTDLQLIG